MDLHENFTRDLSVDKSELFRIWKSSTSGSGIWIQEFLLGLGLCQVQSPVPDIYFSM